MLVLTFRVAEVPYAVAVRRVVEVVPRVGLRALPARPGLPGRAAPVSGGAVPVVDLGLLMGGSACRDRLDTRIILVDGGGPRRAGPGLLGLVAERVDDVRPSTSRGGPSPAWRSRRRLTSGRSTRPTRACSSSSSRARSSSGMAIASPTAGGGAPA